MKTVSATMQTGLDNGTLATCIIITTRNGTVSSFTDHDVQLNDCVPMPGLSRILLNQRENGEVSNQELSGGWLIDLPDEDLRGGVYDDADFVIFLTNWADDPAPGTLNSDKIVILQGNTGILQWSEEGFRVDVHSKIKQLDKLLGETVTASCRHPLYGTASDVKAGFCGVDPASFTFTGNVAAITTNKFKFDVAGNAAGQADSYFTGGLLTWTSGNNSGTTSIVKIHASDNFLLYLPTGFNFQVGDTFSVKAGCDKTFDTCKSKFNNGDNFGGFPHIKNEVNFR